MKWQIISCLKDMKSRILWGIKVHIYVVNMIEIIHLLMCQPKSVALNYIKRKWIKIIKKRGKLNDKKSNSYI